jgi:hypothetical protein
MVSYWAGWPRKAVQYAQQGATDATEVRGTASVWLPALEARAWAALGNAQEAHVAVARASSAREQVVHNELDGLGGKLTFPLARQLYYAADAFVWLDGEEARADEMASAALRAYADVEPLQRSYVDETIARTDSAISWVRRGDVEGAREALIPVLDLEPAERIGGILVSAQRVQRELASSALGSSAQIEELQEELEAFAQVRAAGPLLTP